MIVNILIIIGFAILFIGAILEVINILSGMDRFDGAPMILLLLSLGVFFTSIAIMLVTEGSTIECKEYQVEQRITIANGQPTDTTYVITYRK